MRQDNCIIVHCSSAHSRALFEGHSPTWFQRSRHQNRRCGKGGAPAYRHSKATQTWSILWFRRAADDVRVIRQDGPSLVCADRWLLCCAGRPLQRSQYGGLLTRRPVGSFRVRWQDCSCPGCAYWRHSCCAWRPLGLAMLRLSSIQSRISATSCYFRNYPHVWLSFVGNYVGALRTFSSSLGIVICKLPVALASIVRAAAAPTN